MRTGIPPTVVGKGQLQKRDIKKKKKSHSVGDRNRVKVKGFCLSHNHPLGVQKPKSALNSDTEGLDGLAFTF